MPTTPAAVSPAAVKAQLARAWELESSDRLDEAARTATQAAVMANDGSQRYAMNNDLDHAAVHRRNTALWTGLHTRALRDTGDILKRLGDRSDGVAAVAAYLNSATCYSSAANLQSIDRRGLLSHNADQSEKAADAVIKHLTGTELEDAIAIRVQRTLRIERVNRNKDWQTALVNGALVDRIVSDGDRFARFNNCQRVAPSVVALLCGVSVNAHARKPDGKDIAPQNTRDIYEWAYGRRFVDGSLEKLTQQLRDAGEGAIGIIGIRRPGTNGHVAAVALRDGVPIYFEAQTDDVHVLRGNSLPLEAADAQYSLLLTHDPRLPNLDIDEGQRARAILDAMNSPYIKHDQKRFVWKETPAPAVVTTAISKWVNAGYPGTDVPAYRALGNRLASELVFDAESGAVAFDRMGLKREPATENQQFRGRPPGRMMSFAALQAQNVPEGSSFLMVDEASGRVAVRTRVNGFAVNIEASSRKWSMGNWDASPTAVVNLTGLSVATLDQTNTSRNNSRDMGAVLQPGL